MRFRKRKHNDLYARTIKSARAIGATGGSLGVI